jgi:hypothetical protein
LEHVRKTEPHVVDIILRRARNGVFLDVGQDVERALLLRRRGIEERNRERIFRNDRERALELALRLLKVAGVEVLEPGRQRLDKRPAAPRAGPRAAAAAEAAAGAGAGGAATAAEASASNKASEPAVRLIMNTYLARSCPSHRPTSRRRARASGNRASPIFRCVRSIA